MSLIPGQLCSDSLNILETKMTEHESTDGIAWKGRKDTGDQESLFIHIAQFSDSAESLPAEVSKFIPLFKPNLAFPILFP